MKPAPFEYFAPDTIGEAISLLRRYDGEAKVLAGGQSLVPLLNMRLARPQALVDLNRVSGLSGIREEDGRLVIGAMTRQREVEYSDLVARTQSLLSEAILNIAHPQIRNRGTIGGSLAHADPAAELPAVALALDADFAVAGPAGTRTLPAREFFVTFLTTALRPDEVLTAVSFPVLPLRAGWSVQEVARRQGDFALAGAVVMLSLDGKACSEARISLFGVAYAPLRATSAERALVGEAISETNLDNAAELAVRDLDEPPSDIHASADFRRHLARVMTRRALAEAAKRARNGDTNG
jgi:carbon-monoxide dehydrogenase medium subunit